MKQNDFRGDLTDISAKKEALAVSDLISRALARVHIPVEAEV